MDLVSQILPWIATALTGPIGGMAAKFVCSKLGVPDKTVSEVQNLLAGMSPEKLQELKVHEDEFKLKMLELGYKQETDLLKIDADVIKTVNATMQVELANSATEAWYQKGWRPANGFAVALGSFAGVLAVCWLGYIAIKTQNPTALNMIPALSLAIAGILAVPGAAVGIAAWHRGMQQREAISNGDK